jgi:hypothetical protein
MRYALAMQLDIHPFHQAESGIGMPQATRAPAAAGRAVKQFYGVSKSSIYQP